MKVEIPIIKLELNREESWELLFCIKRELERTIETHWVNFPDTWERNESMKIQAIDILNRASFYPEDILGGLRKHLAECVAKKAAKSP